MKDFRKKIELRKKTIDNDVLQAKNNSPLNTVSESEQESDCSKEEGYNSDCSKEEGYVSENYEEYYV